MTRQNVYDEDDFFTRYQEMREGRTGINEAVEQPALRSLLPPLAGSAVVDLGCGDGQLCRELAAGGAADVLGVDPSARMLELAGSRTDDSRIRYLQAFAEDVALPSASIDLVVSSLALHYIADIDPLLRETVRWLRPGGWFVASMEHPVVTAAPELGPHPCIVDHYADEGRRDTAWFVDGVVKYHRRLSTILNAVIAAGLVVRRVAEPVPLDEALRARPDLQRHARRPAILVVAAVRP